MKIKSLNVQGFRGFNDMQTIDFHDRLTLIYAPNSYGKTSISESFEWLLYGVTSKVDKADSKDEYKGSYRNRHLPAELSPFVSVRFVQGNQECVFTSELGSDEVVTCFTGEGEHRTAVDSWPLTPDIHSSPRPFILQHALKYLLLTNPDDRFRGFARLLGLEDLDEIQKAIIALCTAPERRIPPEVKRLLERVASLEARVASRPTLSLLQKTLKKKQGTVEDLYQAVRRECQNRVPPGTDDTALLPELLKIRQSAVGKLFRGSISLPDYSATEKEENAEDERYFVGFLTESFIREYLELVALAQSADLIKRTRFLDLGIELMGGVPGTCPFCGQRVDSAFPLHVSKEHYDLVEESKQSRILESQRSRIKESLERLKSRIGASKTRNIAKVEPLLALTASLDQLRAILGPKHMAHLENIESAINELAKLKVTVEGSDAAVAACFQSVIASVDGNKEDQAITKALGESIAAYIVDVRHLADAISQKAGAVAAANQVLQHELDIQAGTEDVSLLIDFIDQRSTVAKKYEINTILSRLKDLREAVNQFVGKRMLSAVSGELTSEVMEWYQQIKTTGDPDVHFDGFDLERTKDGEIKARRVKIKAKSYGEELVSAVSSLSESKLNALGLCVSIATNLKGASAFDFLIIDDPIQSLDSAHESQFVDVIRALVEKCGKQVIVLSHNRQWLDQLCTGCRHLNGWFYEITGYTQKGPHISPVGWEKWRERLKLVAAILQDAGSGTVKLQQAEEEIRILVCQITCELYEKQKGIKRSPHSLNSSEVERMLTQCGVETRLVNQILQTFCTTDDSHHAPATYCPDRDRIRQYHGWVTQLSKVLE